MAKIFRISGYLVSESGANAKDHEWWLSNELGPYDCWQQLHVEEGEEFELDGEFESNCDLALLTRHFKKNISTEYDRHLPEPGDVYKHFKLGKEVLIVGISRHTETEEVTVIYSYGGNLWSRPLDMFMSEVDHKKYPSATQKYRFEKVGEA